MVAITIENLVKRFASVTALDGISLQIEPGELFFLLGPSGCGKTTLLRSLAGFCAPDQGKIFFDHEEVTRIPPHKRNTGLMFQSYALFPHLSVAKNVAFGLEERRVPAKELQKRVEAALDSVQMAQYADRKIPELSGGQQQRVALARALVIRPRCLLLDEPLSNLDARLRSEMRSEIRRVCKEAGLTAIYVTHDQKEALSIADRMAILNEGRIAQVGAPEEVYRLPQSPFVAQFLGETDFIEGTIRSAEWCTNLVGDLCEAAGSEARNDPAASTSIPAASQRPPTEAPRCRVSVETALGIFEGIYAIPHKKPVAGEKVILSIRPECWSLREAVSSPASCNCIAGKVDDCVYLGETAQYRFFTPRQELKILELNPWLSSRIKGQEIYAQVRPEDVVVLPAAPQPANS